ncbi:MAG: APC family permease [Actinomycetota bacterium]
MATTQQAPVTGEREGYSLSQAVAVGINTTSPAYSLASILGPMALLVGFATPVVLIVSFIPMALTSLAFLYLNRRDPDCGTTFSWVTRAMGPIPGFMAGWVIAATGILVIGSLAETAVTYTLLMFGQDDLASNKVVILGGASLLIVVMVALAIAGSDSSIKLQSALTYLQIGILLAFGVFAVYTAWQYGLPRFTDEWINPLYWGAESLTAAMLLGVFAFWGWEAATNMSEECRKPTDAGKAGVVSTIILLGTYVLVAVSVVLYMGRSNFEPVGESGLVLVDMSISVFGPLSFLVLLAVAASALASTQSSFIPGSRAVLSMARRGALPAKLGLMHPRFKTPWVSLLTLMVIAVVWFVGISLISESAMLDTLSALGILVAFYYALTGLSCVIYYRKHVTASIKGFLLVGVGPVIGSIGLALMLVIAIRSLWDPATSATGTAWLGLSPPIADAVFVIVLGIVVLIIRRFVAPRFFVSSPPQVANVLDSPFMLDAEKNVPEGGIVLDCNDPLDRAMRAIDAYAADDVDRSTPIYLAFGIRPPEVQGEEYDTVVTALAQLGERTFAEVIKRLKAMGFTWVYRFYVDADAEESVADVAARLNASAVWTDHRVES